MALQQTVRTIAFVPVAATVEGFRRRMRCIGTRKTLVLTDDIRPPACLTQARLGCSAGLL